MSTSEPFIVKICGITNQADARAAVDAGANALGFNFYPKSPRHITPQEARRIVQDVPGNYLKVGVFVYPDEDELITAARVAGLDVLQLHGLHCGIPKSVLYRIWRSFPGGATPPAHDPAVEAYLLDGAGPEEGGSGKTFDWKAAKGFPYRTIVAGGLHAGNVAEAIETLHPWGVDACSKIEAQPGKKDHALMEAFIRAANETVRKSAETKMQKGRAMAAAVRLGPASGVA